MTAGWFVLGAILVLAALAIAIAALVKVQRQGNGGGGGSGSQSSSPVSNFIALSSNMGDGVAQTGVIDWNPTGTTYFQIDDDRSAFNGTTTVTAWRTGSYVLTAQVWGTLHTGATSAVTLAQQINGVTTTDAMSTTAVSAASSASPDTQVVQLDLSCITNPLNAGAELTVAVFTDSGAAFQYQGGFLRVERV
jgi:hypothetical protein